jgi:hypothetical protein
VNETETLALGWQAFRRLEGHVDASSGTLLDGPSTSGWCGPCHQFAAALIRGANPIDVINLRCSEAQEWHRQVLAANAVAEKVLPEGAGR